MSGPPYPPLPAAGSNGIGIGQIGTMPIGDIAPFDWPRTLISQYANSPIICGLIERFALALDQTENISNFYDLMFNLDTAQGYGLDCWGRIVGVNRTLALPTVEWFGFSESLPGCLSFNDAGPMQYAASIGFAEARPEASDIIDAQTSQPFGQGTFGLFKVFANTQTTGGAFYPAGAVLTTNFDLTDDSYRTLIIAKAMANITDGSIPSINGILVSLFPNRGNCYVTDGPPIPVFFGFAEQGNTYGFNDVGPVTYLPSLGFAETDDPLTEPFGQAPFGPQFVFSNKYQTGAEFYSGQIISRMSINYVFDFALSQLELAIVEQSGVLPKPTGVKANVVVNGAEAGFATPNIS